MSLSVGYNFQGNNINFAGKFSGWWQCMSTCAWMIMSNYTDRIDAADDLELARYLDGVETTIGKVGIGEKVKRKYNWITGRTSLWWLTHKAGIEEMLWSFGVSGEVKFYEKTMDYITLIRILDKDPVMIGTKKMGGVDGHIILAIGYDKCNIICHDPAGDAKTNYKNKNGKQVKYPIEFLEKYTGDKFNALHWVGKLE